ncbi:MAG TPA: ELWxxDGT repeat protein [Thermoanaerobaculia bacterium]|nr:ELWxxDGT repeat protein [Thermoanaerobaculia bacterium]
MSRLVALATLVFLGLPSAIAVPASAQSAYLVKDLAQGIADGSPSLTALFPTADRLFFRNDTDPRSSGAGLPRLWVSDGTAGGTQALPDLCVDSCSHGPVFVAALGRVAFFIEGSAADGDQLWRSDGTPAGTFRLIGRLRLIADPKVFAVWKRGVYFIAYADQAGGGDPSEQLWRSDGTRAGTVRISDLGPGLFSARADALAVAGAKLFFAAPRAAPRDARSTLWVSDGTAAGTRPASAAGPIQPRQLTPLGERIFFVATAAGSGPADQLWVSDGSAAGTMALTPLPLFIPSVALKAGQERLYFQADDGVDGNQLWMTDGTAAGTHRLTSFPGYSNFSGPEEIGGRLVFVSFGNWESAGLWALSPESPESLQALCPASCGPAGPPLVKVGDRVLYLPGDEWEGFDLWSTDGTVGGTVRLKNVCPPTPGPRVQHGNCDGGNILLVQDGSAFISVEKDEGPVELWRSDGTRAGTLRFTDRPIDYSLQIAAIAGLAFFVASDSEAGDELWASDGTAAGTRQLTDLNVSRYGGFGPYAFVRLGDELFFNYGGIWRTDGTAAGTLPVTDFFVNGGIVAAAGAAFFFSFDDQNRMQLWVADGSPGGVRQLTHFAEVTESIDSGPVAASGQVFFVAGWGGDDPAAMWRSDGTPQGTGKAFDLPPAVAVSGGVRDLTSLGSDFYFTNHLQAGPLEVWKSDGTTAGTVQLAVSCCPPDFAITPFIRIGGTVYFIAYTGPGQSYLRQTDGTPAGTGWVELKGSPVVNPTGLLAVGGTLYLFADAAAQGDRSLWRTDGTPAGTSELATFRGGSGDAAPRSLTPFGSGVGVAFVADDGVHGLEPWISDGTAAGTRMLADILPGGDGSRPSGLMAAAGRLFFAANDGVHGFELWQSDGTAAGTRMVQDIAPGPLSSNPASMTQLGDTLYFSADDGLIGPQLWALPLGGGSAGCQPTATALCLAGGRFRVEVLWRNFQHASGAGQAVPLTGDSGYFWFWNPDEVEIVAKIVDGRPLDGHFWVFYGALSSVEYSLTVTDTRTGLTRRYYNPPGQLASVGDTHAFGPLGAGESSAAGRAATTAGRLDGGSAPASLRPRRSTPPAAGRAPDRSASTSQGCQPGPTRLCLDGARFAVEAAWTDSNGRSGSGNAVGLASGSGYFWFFDPGSVEVVLKVIDGRAVNGKFWLYYGALSDVGYTLTVTDTLTGAVKVYSNPAGQLASVADTSAF